MCGVMEEECDACVKRTSSDPLSGSTVALTTLYCSVGPPT